MTREETIGSRHFVRVPAAPKFEIGASGGILGRRVKPAPAICPIESSAIHITALDVWGLPAACKQAWWMIHGV